MTEIKQSNSTFSTAQWISMFVISMLAGGVGSYTIISYSSEMIGNSRLNEISANTMSRTRPVIQQVKTVTIQQDDQIQRIVEESAQNLLLLLPATGSKIVDTNQNQGELLPLTSDGWAIGNANILTDQKLWSNLVIINHQKEKFKIERVVFDKYTNLFFVKTSAKNLEVKKFTDSSVNANGSLLISTDWHDAVGIFYQLNQKLGNATSTIKNTDNLTKYIITDKTPTSLVIYNLSNEIAGIVNSKKEIISADSVSRDFSILLDTNKIDRPSLGIFYTDNIYLVSLDQNSTQTAKGVTVYLNTPQDIAKTSPLYLAGLRNKDIILAVNETEIDNNFAELILGIKSKDDTKLKIQRGKEVISIIIRGQKAK